MILEQIYRNFPKDTIEGEKARTLLFQTHWFSSIAELDPRTAEALPQTLSAVLWKISAGSSDPSAGLKDRLWRITEHVRLSLEKLFHELNESPHREHAILPIRSVRELDTTSFMAVSRRPGRNIREKLAGKPYMLAVQRVLTVDLPENRLLKAFSEQLVEFLELRREFLGEKPDELIDIIHSWLWTDEAQSISYWDNVPPNNTLLTHRDYRAVYDAWCWLQSLDDDLDRDLKNIDKRQKTLAEWQSYGKMYAQGKHIFAEIPVLFDYDKFELCPWGGQIFSNPVPRATRSVPIHETVPLCVDLTNLHPTYALLKETSDSSSQNKRDKLQDSFLWQSWQNSDALLTSVDINLFKADALYLHPDAVTVSSPDLFFSHKHEVKNLDRAAHAFVSKLHDFFVSKTLVWLQPDFLNDFELTITRRNINTVYPGAQPLPRSVAAVFESINYKQLSNGFSVIVLDGIGGVKCATKLEAKFDETLKKCLPETRGFYWERHPPVILSRKDLNEQDDAKVEYDMTTLDAQGKWQSPANPQTDCNISQNQLRQEQRLGQFNSVIQIAESPVIGGIRLFELQERAGEIPLWRDQIPELSIKGWKNGRYERFYLVDRGTTVKTIRGKAISIPVKEKFTLPAGKRHYQFPLYIGEDEEAIGFSARLESPNFPLNNPLECRLNLTFTYGEDDPYCLIFEPINSEFRPIHVQWTKTKEEVVTDASAPEYPQILSWNDLRKWKDAQGVETDLLKWVIDSLRRLQELMPVKRDVTIMSNWRCKKSEGGSYWFTFGMVNGNHNCYCSTRNFLEFNNSVDPNIQFPPGTVLYCFVQKTAKGISAQSITDNKTRLTLSTEAKQKITQFKERSLQNRISCVWGDGRSLRDNDCPSSFRTDFERLFSDIVENLPEDIILRKMRFLQACLHKDAPDECVTWLAAQIDSNKIIDKRAVGFSLGDISDPWQEAMFDSLVAHLTNDAVRVFAYAIWRHPDFVWKFTMPDYLAILKRLCIMLNKITPCPPKKNEKDKWTVRNWVRSTTEPLELLLGLLRTRSSSNNEIKMLLQPHQKITKELAKLVEKVTGIVAESRVTVFSRVQLGNLPQKPDGDLTPDLLYALRLYLTGDDGANAIQITGISDGDTD